MTTNHLRLVLDQARDTHMLCQMADQVGQARTPPAVHNILRLGRLTALQKARGGVRGIVVGDVLRRHVARTMAHQFGKSVEAATAPHQYALSTRAGTECVAHALQVLTEMDPLTTIVSMEWERTIPSPGRPCWRHWCPYQEGQQFFHLSDSSMASHPGIYGKRTEPSTTSTRARVENRGIHSCPCSFHWANTLHLRL